MLGIVSSIRSEFQRTEHHGCYFHMSKAALTRVGTLGLAGLYKNREDGRVFRKFVRCLIGLAFLPVERVVATFNQLKQAAPAVYNGYANYFEIAWISSPNIPLELWNVFGSDRRTNNAMEGLNHRFNSVVMKKKYHPNIWDFYNCLKSEEAATEVSISMIKGGKNLVTPNPDYEEAQARIGMLNHWLLRGEISEIEFVEGIALIFTKIVSEEVLDDFN